MEKIILASVLFLFAIPVHAAESCWPLYQKKAQEIQKEGAYDTYVGGQFYINQGQLAYWEGIKMAGHVDNWAQDFMDAIKWGPYKFMPRPDDPRKAWLKTLQKSIKNMCPLENDDDYEVLRAMLKELMDDGSLCANQKIHEPNFLGNKSDFKKVLMAAVKDNRFMEYCHNNAISDDSNRKVKDVSENNRGPTKKISTQQ